MSEKKKKVGRFGDDEREKIKRMLQNDYTLEEMAESLGRSEEAIANEINAIKIMLKYGETDGLVDRLHKTHYWSNFKKSLINDIEIQFFEREWSALMRQFLVSDVVHTDEMMVRDLVMHDIFILRNREEIASFRRRKDELEDRLQKELMKDSDKQDSSYINLLKDTSALLVVALSSKSKEYCDLNDEKTSLFKALKSTRQQRLEQTQEQSKDIFTLVMNLDSLEEREHEGRMAGLRKKSMDKKQEEFMSGYAFDDGKIDSILLNSETMEYREKMNAPPSG
jgi:predicted DNA-binding protein YlxM (UPF0122 family)